MSLPDKEPQILSTRELYRSKWMKLEEVHWETGRGPHSWERVQRVGKTRSVYIIARLKSDGRYVLVRQFRPAVGGWLYEFPAGLIDEGEDAAETALRELKEETGYSGKILRTLKPRVNSPGMSGEATAVAFAEIDDSLPENIRPQAALDGGEAIEVVLMSRREAESFALEENEHSDELFDGKLTAYFLGTASLG